MSEASRLCPVVHGSRIFHPTVGMHITNSATVAKFIIQPLGPPVFMLVITFISNRRHD